MTRANKALIVLVVAAMGVWGCAQRPSPVGLERIKALEAKCSKLEDDYKAVATARDQARKKVADAEEQRAKLQQDSEQQQQQLVKERDDLKAQLAAKTTERDALQTQFDGFRKSVRSLLNQADSAAATLSAPPAVSTTAAPAGGKS
jgi:chromosome segregation ATPase